jgi:hypothetical protein
MHIFNLLLRLVKNHALKAFEGVEALIHVFLTLALDTGNGSVRLWKWNIFLYEGAP